MVNGDVVLIVSHLTSKKKKKKLSPFFVEYIVFSFVIYITQKFRIRNWYDLMGNCMNRGEPQTKQLRTSNFLNLRWYSRGTATVLFFLQS
jgi:hypothetical protein